MMLPSASGAALAALLAVAHTAPAAPPQPDTLIPGITVWVYDLGDPLTQDRRPTVAEGQTPNHYSVAPVIQFTDGFDTAFGPLRDNFAGEIRGWLLVAADAAGDYTFRVRCDDGAALLLDGRTVADTEAQASARFTAVGTLHLAAGLHPLSIPFYEDHGQFSLSLEWRPPGADAFVPVPQANLRTEAGQTFATSPGPKRWFYGRDPNRPGDGRPLESVHPAFTLEEFRGPDFQPPVGGMAFLPDGRLAVCTWDPTGSVYLLDNLDASEPGGIVIKRFASGLGEPLGLAHFRGDLYVTQKQEVTRLRDLDGDGIADEYFAVCSGWPASQNYHEFSFNLQPLDDHFFITTSVPLKSGDTNYTPGTARGAPDRDAYAVGDGPGSVLRIDPATGAYEVFARGLRAPNGLGIGPDGEIFGCDNQGAWLPASRLNHLRRGGFYGHQTTPDGSETSDPPVAWFPHGEIGNSPTQPVLIPDGPYRRQLLVGDVTHGGINRVFVESVGGHYQGCVFQFSQGLEAGVNRLIWGPDGCLYVGGIGSNGNWHHQNKKFGLQRLRPNGRTPFEILKVESRADGFVITFTRPVPQNILGNPDSYEVSSWRYTPTVEYGGPKRDLTRHAVTSVTSWLDRSRAFIALPPAALTPGNLVYIRLRGVMSDDLSDLGGPPAEEPFVTEAWYTLNAVSDAPGPGFDARPLPETLDRNPPSNAVILFDGTSLDRFTHADHDRSAPTWTIENGELIVRQSGGAAAAAGAGGGSTFGGDIVTRESFGDCFLHMEWLSPAGGSLEKQTNGNSGVKLQSRYEIQIMNSPAWPHEPRFNQAGAIYRQRAADHNASLGAGVWQTYDLRFRAPRFDALGQKTRNARLTLWWNGVLVHDDVEVSDKTGMSPSESPGNHPLLLQAHTSEALGEVRFRNIWLVPE